MFILTMMMVIANIDDGGSKFSINDNERKLLLLFTYNDYDIDCHDDHNDHL